MLFSVPSYPDQLQMRTDMSLDDLSCTQTTLHTDHVSQLFSGGIPVTYTKVYPIYKYMRTYTLSCPFDSLSAQTVTERERPWRSHSVCSFPQPGSGSPGAGTQLPQRRQLGRSHLKLQSSPFTCGLSKYCL